MHHHDKFAHSSAEHIFSTFLPEGASFRFLAAMAQAGLDRGSAPASFSAYEALVARGRAERQDSLLDAALLETFPASDPVSVVLVD